MVKGDKGPTRKMNKFKYLAAYLIPWDHVSKNCNTNRRRGSAEISNISGIVAQASTYGYNQGRGFTYVDLLHYKYDEFNILSKEQHNEITEWCRSHKNGGKADKHDQVK